MWITIGSLQLALTTASCNVTRFLLSRVQLGSPPEVSTGSEGEQLLYIVDARGYLFVNSLREHSCKVWDLLAYQENFESASTSRLLCSLVSTGIGLFTAENLAIVLQAEGSVVPLYTRLWGCVVDGFKYRRFDIGQNRNVVGNLPEHWNTTSLCTPEAPTICMLKGYIEAYHIWLTTG